MQYIYTPSRLPFNSNTLIFPTCLSDLTRCLHPSMANPLLLRLRVCRADSDLRAIDRDWIPSSDMLFEERSILSITEPLRTYIYFCAFRYKINSYIRACKCVHVWMHISIHESFHLICYSWIEPYSLSQNIYVYTHMYLSM
jgi:hypothetical protein